GDTTETLPLPSASPKPKSAPLLPSDCIITPSMTYSGSAFELIVACPRTRIDIDEPGAPDVATADTPAARPCNAWSRLVDIDPLTASSSNVTEDPETLLFRTVP